MDIIETYKKPWFKEPFYIGTAFVFLALFSLFIYTGYIDNASEQVELKTEFNGIVKNTFTQRRTLYISLENPERKIKLETLNNWKYEDEGYTLRNIIEKGNKVAKKRNSDTIVLFKNNRTYFFQLEKKTKTHPNN